MKMDLDLFYNWNKDYKKISKLLLNNFQKYNINAREEDDNTNNDICICTALFTVWIEIDLENNKNDSEYVAETYGLNINSSMRIQLFQKTAEEGIDRLLQAFGKLFKKLSGDLLLVENGEVIIVKRQNGKLEVFDNEDYYHFKLPVEHLTGERRKK
jgi:uncharacterized protein YbcI